MNRSKQTYSYLSRHLHWLTAIAIIGLFTLGWTMVPLELTKQKLEFYAWHKWLGLCVFTVIVLRLALRLIVPPPLLSQDLPAIVTKLAKTGHGLLYASLLLLPLSGWLRSSTAGIEIVIFEQLPIPSLLAKNEALSKYFETIHWALGWGLLTLIIGHIAAVVAHHQVFQDQILRRMPPANLYLPLIAIALSLGLLTNYTYQPKRDGSIPGAENKQSAEQSKIAKKTTPKTIQSAGSWQLQKSNSTLIFAASQKGAATEGEFKKFELDLSFDKTNPKSASLTVTIDMAAMTMSNILADSALHSADWFDVTNHPSAKFTANGFQHIEGDQYQIDGRLTIRNIKKKLSVPIKITITTANKEPARKVLHALGTVTILRLDYGLGKGEWQTTETLANEVKLSIDITATQTQ